MESATKTSKQGKASILWNCFTMIACILGLVNALCLCLFLTMWVPQMKQDLQQQLQSFFRESFTVGSTADRQKRAPPGSFQCERGPPGRDGRDGRDGVRGDSGPPGLTGSRGPPGPVNPDIYATTQINEVMRRIDIILNTSQHCGASPISSGSVVGEGGSVFVRWGRTTCPGHARNIYNGVTGGSHFSHKGSGANYICLPLDPDWTRTTDGHQTASSVYGCEYETSTYKNPLFSRLNADGKSLHNHDVPCAVCHAESRNSHVMIPAKLNCPSGWNKEYSGYLMSSHIGHNRAEYVCVDIAPEADQSGHKNEDGALLYFVEAYCGSLPCPSYQEGHELTCVVCTK